MGIFFVRPVCRLAVFSGVVLLLTWAVSGPGHFGRAEAKEPRPGTGTTYALLIGCATYPALGPGQQLEGCVNDVELMQKTLVEVLGVAPANIRILSSAMPGTAAAPTSANVRRELLALMRRVYKSGDRVIVHYAGHGIQVTDDNRDELDGLDEAWLLADGRKAADGTLAGFLRDDEIGRTLRAVRARGATVCCFMDCCHSATGLRGVPAEPTRTRGVDAASLGISIVPAATRGHGAGFEGGAIDHVVEGKKDIVVFYAAQSFQEVPEVRLPLTGANRKPYGLLTSTAVRALKRSGDRLTFGELYEQIAVGYRDLGQHHVVQPLAEGDLGLAVHPGSGAHGVPLMVRRVARRRLELTGGALHGLAAGTELEVFAPGGGGANEKPVGRVVIRTLGGQMSHVVPAPGSSDAWAQAATGPWPARISRFVVPDTRLPLAVVDARGASVPWNRVHGATRTLLGSKVVRARFPPAASPAQARWVLVVDTTGAPVRIRPAAHGAGAASFQVTATTLQDTLHSIFRAENLLGLAGRIPRGGELPPNLDLDIRVRTGAQAAAPLRPGQRVPPGAVLEFGLRKEKARAMADVETVDVFVFWIDPHFGISMLYPTETSGPRLGVDDVTTGPARIRVGYAEGEPTNDVSQGTERIVVFALPMAKDQPHLQLGFLTQPPLEVKRGLTSRDGVEALLHELAFGSETTRGGPFAADAGKLRMKVYSFDTRWGRVRVPSGTATSVPKPAATRGGNGPMDAWQMGPSAHVARAGSEGPACFLVSRSPEAAQVLVDLDGEVPRDKRSGAGLSALVAGRGMDAEMALRIEASTGRLIAWYDSDDDGRFDLVLEDRDGDFRADTRHQLRGGVWTKQAGLDLDLLSTRHLTYLGDDFDRRHEALARIRALTVDGAGPR